MTKNEFIDGYCERSGLSRELFDAKLVAEPREVGAEDSCGWVAMPKDNPELRSMMAAGGFSIEVTPDDEPIDTAVENDLPQPDSRPVVRMDELIANVSKQPTRLKSLIVLTSEIHRLYLEAGVPPAVVEGVSNLMQASINELDAAMVSNTDPNGI